MEGIEWIYFGGGEPFTLYPFLLKAIHRARKLDFRVGVETNGYFARTDEAGLRMLRPLAFMGVEDLRISNDRLHYRRPENSPAHRALRAAQKLGIPTTLVATALPGDVGQPQVENESATRIEVRRFMFAGRASELLTSTYPPTSFKSFDRCPKKDLSHPDRVYVDAYGFVQICPGIAIGNACQAPLPEIIAGYDPDNHEILKVLNNLGPAGLVEKSGFPQDTQFVDACHGCFASRKQLLDEYPDLLGPRLVYAE